MNVEARTAAPASVQWLRDVYISGADCQIVHYSALPRRLADPYVILLDGRPAGYGAVWNRYFEGRVVEFHSADTRLDRAVKLFEGLLVASGATALEAQTNMPLMLRLLRTVATGIQEEKVLFEDVADTCLPDPAGALRELSTTPAGSEWVLEVGGEPVAAGGYLTHYNPPFVDIYMEVKENARGRGFGSYLVQELKRIACQRGYRPAARCNPDNHASRRTLEKAGFGECGRLLAGRLARRGEGQPEPDS